MVLTTKAFENEPKEDKLEGYEFVKDAEGKMSLKKIRKSKALEVILSEQPVKVKKVKKKRSKK